MKRYAVVILALVLGCGSFQKAPEPPVVAEAPEYFIHRVENPGETLGEIARWHTGKFENWKKLTRPVNPELTRCCATLKLGREVRIPRDLVVQTDPMPKPDVVTRPSKPLVKATPGKPSANAGEASHEGANPPAGRPTPEPLDDDGKEALEEPPLVAEAPAAVPTAMPTATPPPEPAVNASGKVMLKGQSWKVADAIAYLDGSMLEIALSSKRFQRKKMSQDGKLDSFDVMNHRMNTEASTVTLKIDANGTLDCFDYSVGGGGSRCGTSASEAWKLRSRDDHAIAGSFVWMDGADAIDLTFDLPIVREVKRAGEPLPAGGGEPGKAVLSRFAANLSGDLDKILALTNPDQRKEMEVRPIDAEEKTMMLDFMKASTPNRAKVVGGVIDGDSAMVDFEGTIDGQKATGTAEVHRVGGKWYVGAVTTKQ